MQIPSNDNDADLAAGLYLPPSWQALKQQLVYLAQFGGGIQVVQGLLGAGKSTLHQLLVDEQIGADFLAVTVKEEGDVDEFLFELLWQLGLRPERGASVGAMIVILRGYVQSLHDEGARVVVSIDNAHFISDAELAALVSVLQGSAESGIGLHLILFSEPGLIDKVDALQLVDIEIHDSTVPRLSATEVEQFLYAKGFALSEAPKPELLRQVWRASHGLPGGILWHFERLSAATAPNADLSSSPGAALSLRGLPYAHISAVAVLSIVLIWAFLVRDDQVVPEVESPPTALTYQQSKPIAVSSASLASQISAPVSPQVESSLAAGVQERVEVTRQSLNRELSSQAGQAASAKAGNHPTKSAEKVAGFKESGLKLDANSAEGVNSSAAVQQMSSVTAQPASEVNEGGNPVPSVDAQQRVAQVVKPRDAVGFEQGESMLQSYPADGYVLQIMAASDFAKLADYARHQPNVVNLMTYRAKRKGRLFYILVEGFYADKESAQAAVANLPLVQRRGGPWPKKIALIHRDIAEFR